MKLLANENFPLDSVFYLKERGFDIRAIGIDDPSILDSEVMEIAIREERIILTFDRDYGELIFKQNYRPPMGVIYLRLFDYDSGDPGKAVEKLLNNTDFNTHMKLTVVEANIIRQKQY